MLVKKTSMESNLYCERYFSSVQQLLTPAFKQPLWYLEYHHQVHEKGSCLCFVFVGEDDAALASGNMNKETCIEQMTALFGEEVLTDLQDTVWKKRLEALDTIIQAAKEIDIVANAKLLVNGMANVPGWGEKNFQVMSRQFELIRFAAERGEASFGKSEAFVAIKGLYEKMGDMKLKTPASDALSMICEAVGPQFVFDQMHCKAASHKNPKVSELKRGNSAILHSMKRLQGVLFIVDVH